MTVYDFKGQETALPNYAGKLLHSLHFKNWIKAKLLNERFAFVKKENIIWKLRKLQF
jgi:hypothetical protein